MTDRNYAGIELGGTTCVAAMALNSPENIIAQIRIPTTNPFETFQKLLEFLSNHTFVSIGIASFGPLDLNKESTTYGYITTTPKNGWENTNVIKYFKDTYPTIPILIDTDVNVPALYEAYHYKNIKSMDSSACYITVGTGVGVGICINGKPLHGMMHPEGGHIYVPFHDKDKDFEGTCKYHNNCIEGMIGSHALLKRAIINKTNNEMIQKVDDLKEISDQDELWDITVHYLAYLCLNLTLTVSPNIIIIGGGIPSRKIIFPKLYKKFLILLNGYVKLPRIEEYIRPSICSNVGIVSALWLAENSIHH